MCGRLQWISFGLTSRVAGLIKRWTELTLRAQVTIVVLAGLVLLQVVSVWIDVVQIREDHIELLENRGDSFLSEVLPVLAHTPVASRAELLERFSSAERFVDLSTVNGAETLKRGEQHAPIGDWIRSQLTPDFPKVAQIAVTDRQIDLTKNTTGFARDLPALRAIQRQLAFDVPSRKRWTLGVYAVRLEGESNWINFYVLMAPENFWPVLLARSVDSLVGIGLMVVLAFLVGHVMAPLGKLTANSERLGRGEETGALEPEGSVDVREAILAFNRMETRIVHSLSYQVALLRSLGHDLSGPLQRLRDATGDVAPEETRERIDKRLSAVDAIVQSVASFARETRRDADTSRVDIASMLEALVEEQAETGRSAEISIEAEPVVRGRYNALTRAFRNLVENAIKYGNAVRVTVASEGGMAVVHVDDEGPGIAAEELEAAFEPFQRLGASGPGSGLGLSIVQTIIIDHGGTVELSNLEGGGLRASVRLPLETR